MKLIVGLGNPGGKYENTRHNAGFIALDEVQSVFGCSEFKKSVKRKALISEGQIGTEKVVLVKPQTFMNLSGQSVQGLVHFLKIDLSDVVVIYDDVDIESGKLRVRGEGSAAGHNGIKSLIQCLGSDQFIRIRLGVKPITEFKGDLADYVLGQLSNDEKELLNQNVQKLPGLLELLFESGLEEVMQRFN